MMMRLTDFNGKRKRKEKISRPIKMVRSSFHSLAFLFCFVFFLFYLLVSILWNRTRDTSSMACGCSAIFILDMKGKILISRDFRGDVPLSCAERFISRIMEKEELDVKPITEEDGVTYIYIKPNNIYREHESDIYYYSISISSSQAFLLADLTNTDKKKKSLP